MKPIKLSTIAEVTGGKLLCGDGSRNVDNVVTDSRKLTKDCLFVPLAGEKFDGHDFIENAFDGGAAASLTAKETSAPPEGRALILVEDTLRALQQIAAYYRGLFPVSVVGLTGSVGKTTTKEMTAAVLERKYRTLKTEGNFNNEIGLPLTVFRLEDSHQTAVLEMGMSGFGEIGRLSAIARPDLAMITNIGMSHIELLGSQENIYRAKSEILQNVKPGGTVIVNDDDAILRAHKEEITHRVYTVGKNGDCDAVASQVQSDEESVRFTFSGFGRHFEVVLNIPGEHNVYNALFAIAAGIHFGVEDTEIVRALAKFRPAGMRMDLIPCNGFTIINDCYNAAPDSMKAALKVLGAYEGKKIAVLGDIACLGEYSYEAHLGVGALAAKAADELFTVGEQARLIAQGAFEGGMDSAKIHSFDAVAELLPQLPAALESGCHVLVKASRVMELERVTKFLSQL